MSHKPWIAVTQDVISHSLSPTAEQGSLYYAGDIVLCPYGYDLETVTNQRNRPPDAIYRTIEYEGDVCANGFVF